MVGMLQAADTRPRNVTILQPMLAQETLPKLGLRTGPAVHIGQENGRKPGAAPLGQNPRLLGRRP
eukprot:3728172-Lingulodinium_polyedra.AAC.1